MKNSLKTKSHHGRSAEPNSGHGPDLAMETTVAGTSKPIKKKAPIFSVEDDVSEESPDEGNGGAPFSPPSTREVES